MLRHHFGKSDDGIERGAQLMAHAREELRLVLARQFELAALLLDFAEQARILDRQHRLIGERFEKFDRAPREFPGLTPPHYQRTDDLTGAQ
jgi:hypothetical protein